MEVKKFDNLLKIIKNTSDAKIQKQLQKIKLNKF